MCVAVPSNAWEGNQHQPLFTGPNKSRSKGQFEVLESYINHVQIYKLKNRKVKSKIVNNLLLLQ